MVSSPSAVLFYFRPCFGLNSFPVYNDERKYPPNFPRWKAAVFWFIIIPAIRLLCGMPQVVIYFRLLLDIRMHRPTNIFSIPHCSWLFTISTSLTPSLVEYLKRKQDKESLNNLFCSFLCGGGRAVVFYRQAMHVKSYNRGWKGGEDEGRREAVKEGIPNRLLLLLLWNNKQIIIYCRLNCLNTCLLVQRLRNKGIWLTYYSYYCPKFQCR